MTEIDAPDLMRRWFSSRQGTWKEEGVGAQLRLPEQVGLNKACTTLETGSHVASLTSWGNGWIEFIVLELESRKTVICKDTQAKSSTEVESMLEEHAKAFGEMVRRAPAK